MTTAGKGGRGSGRKADAGRLFVIASIALLCVVLGVGAVVHAASDGFEEDVERSWSQFNRSRRPEVLATITEQSRRALNRHPLNTRSASLLAMVHDSRGDQKNAEAMMRAAARMNRRDTAISLWMFQRDLQNRKFESAFVYIDAYLRRRPEAVRAWAPILGSAALDPAALSALAERLAAKPSWRTSFYAALPELTPDAPGFAYPLLDATLRAGSPPTAIELDSHLGRLVRVRRYEEAFQQWRRLSGASSATGGLNNGNFEEGPHPPFGWSETPNSGNIEQASAYGRDENALRLHYDGFSPTSFPTQLIMLKPGAYRLSGEYLTENAESAGRVQWTVACADQPEQALAAHVPVDTAGAWRKFDLQFSVPASGCVAQWTGAKAATGFNRVNVGVWYDRLTLASASGARP